MQRYCPGTHKRLQELFMASQHWCRLRSTHWTCPLTSEVGSRGPQGIRSQRDHKAARQAACSCSRRVSLDSPVVCDPGNSRESYAWLCGTMAAGITELRPEAPDSRVFRQKNERAHPTVERRLRLFRLPSAHADTTAAHQNPPGTATRRSLAGFLPFQGPRAT